MVANKVEKLLVTSGTTAATVAALAAGQHIALVQGKANNAPIVKGDKFQLAVKKLNGEMMYTDVIKADDIVKVQLNKYSAPTNQTFTVTLTTANVGSTYTLSVIGKADKEIFGQRQDKVTASVTAVTGDTVTTLAAKLVAVINGAKASRVTASNAAGVITLVAKKDSADAAGLPGLQHFVEVFISETDALGATKRGGTVANTVPVNFGTGTLEQVKEIERYAQGYEGYLNQTKFPVIQYPSDLVAGRTYDLLVISYDNNYWSNSTVAGKVDSPIEIVVAVTAGATTALETLFAAFLPSA